LLEMDKEEDRQTFLYQHLKRTLPIMKDIEYSKQIIKLNGHFKHIDPLQF